MKSEVKFISPGLKVSVVIGACFTIIVITLALIYRTEFSVILLGVGGSVVALGAVATIGRVYQLGHNRELNHLELEERRARLRIVQLEADHKALEAVVLAIPSSQRILTLPGSNLNIIEAIPGQYKVLADTAQDTDPLDLLTVFTQATQSYACVGGQQTGKTYQMRHIAAYWLRNGIKPVVIGPKWDRGEWAGCILFGGNGDFGAVSQGITVIRRIVETRHASTDKTHKQHQILPVFFDDWTPIVDSVDNARALVLEATTLYASVNVLLYFILHSDTAAAWGVDRKGAALKDNFIKLFIIPHYDTAGLIVRDKTRGVIRFAGEDVERPVKLFSLPVPAYDLAAADVGYPVDLSPADLCDVQPTPGEAAVLRMHTEGATVSDIAAAVYGNKGGNQNERVKQILAKYAMV